MKSCSGLSVVWSYSVYHCLVLFCLSLSCIILCIVVLQYSVYRRLVLFCLSLSSLVLSIVVLSCFVYRCFVSFCLSLSSLVLSIIALSRSVYHRLSSFCLSSSFLVLSMVVLLEVVTFVNRRRLCGHKVEVKTPVVVRRGDGLGWPGVAGGGRTSQNSARVPTRVEFRSGQVHVLRSRNLDIKSLTLAYSQEL